MFTYLKIQKINFCLGKLGPKPFLFLIFCIPCSMDRILNGAMLTGGKGQI